MANSTEAQQIVPDLLEHGGPRHEISLVMPHPEVQEAAHPNGEGETTTEVKHDQAELMGIDAALGGIGGLLVGLTTFVIPGIGPLIAAGSLAVALAGSEIGASAGVIIGHLIYLGVTEHAAGQNAEGLRRGARW